MVEENPFGNSDNGEYWLAYELSPRKAARILDFGCGDGYFISQFKSKAKEIYACDIDAKRVENARTKYPFLKFVVISPYKKLPFITGSFDLIFAIGVLEHVKSPGFVLEELARVLRKKGRIIIHVPHRGLMTLFDAGNLKFYFPTLHRFLYYFVFGKKKYQQEFISKKKLGMFGDFAVYKGMQHRHFGLEELKKLLSKSGLYPERIIRFSLFLPVLYILQNLFQFFLKRQSRVLHQIIKWDNCLHLGCLSNDIIIVAQKK